MTASDPEDNRDRREASLETIPPPHSFAATIVDPLGWDAIPCLLLTQLNTLYFPACVIGIRKQSSGESARMRDIFSLMMLAAGHGEAVTFECETDTRTFALLEGCLRHLFQRRDHPDYGDTYCECSKLLQDGKGDGPERLLEELSHAMRGGNRKTLLARRGTEEEI